MARWGVEQRVDQVCGTGKRVETAKALREAGEGVPRSIAIDSGGAAGNAAAEMLRREGYARTITMFSADDSPPCDRPNLSKNYLVGTAQHD